MQRRQYYPLQILLETFKVQISRIVYLTGSCSTKIAGYLNWYKLKLKRKFMYHLR